MTNTLSLIQTPNLEQWSNELNEWLKTVPKEYNIPTLWDTFLQELRTKVQSIQQNNAYTEIDNLKMEGLKVKSYVDKFETLAERANLSATNPQTIHLFMKGLTNSVRTNICKKPIYGYRMARAYALNDVLTTRIITALLQQTSNPTNVQETPTPQTRKRPLAEDYLEGPATKEARIARLTTNQNFPTELFESR